MRHRVYGRKLGRKTNHRIAMWRNMATSLFEHGQITTTIPKAKSLQPFVEKIITAAKPGDLHARRKVTKMLGNDRVMADTNLHQFDGDDFNAEKKALEAEGYKFNKFGDIKAGPKIVHEIVDKIAPKYKERNGGCTRIIKLGKHRIGDGSDLCVIQLVGEEEEGPTVSGNFSRRREKANKRMEFAAKLRKGPQEEAKAEPTEEVEEAPVEQVETPADDVSGEEAKSE